MRRYELASEPVVVWKDNGQREPEVVDGLARLRATTPDELLEAVDKLSPADLETTVVDIDSASSQDDLVALAAALVHRGVVAIETRYALAVNRVFTTHRAIESGAIETGAL